MRFLRMVIIFVGLMLAWSPAWAGGQEARERAARKACLTGDFSKGVDLLAELFLDTKDITYIFNQGRCFEQNRRYEEAVGRFREYLVKGSSLGREEKADAEKHLSVCLSYLGKTDANQPFVAEEHKAGPVSAPTTSSEGLTSATPLLKPQPPAIGESSPQAGQSSRGASLRTIGIVAATVGVAGVAMGILLNVKVNSMSSDLEKPYNYTRSADSTRQTYKTIGWVGYGVGAAGIVAGAALYFLGRSKAEELAGNNVTLAPAIASGSVGATFAGTFQ
jgi:hypothetical protein